MGTHLPFPKGAQFPNFRPLSVVAKWLDRWTKMLLGMEVVLSPGDFGLDGDPVPLPKKGAEPPSPNFRPMFIVAGWIKMLLGWMDQDATWHEGRPQPRRLCVRWGPSPLPTKGVEPLSNFRPISIVAKRLDSLRCHLVWRYSSAQGTLG